eukprot:12393466-Alexandrium_andersonii.AAC.1
MKRKGDSTEESDKRRRGIEQLWQSWERKGMIREAQGWWSDQETDRQWKGIRGKKGLLTVTGVWEECRGDERGEREIRDQ